MRKVVLWLPKDNGAQKGSFSVLGLGIREAMPPGHVYRPRGMDSFLLMHFHDPVDIEVLGKIKKYPANTFVLWRPWDSHHFGSSKRVWQHSWLHCYGKKVIEAALCDSDIKWGEPLRLSHSPSVEAHLSQIYKELISRTSPDKISIQCMVTLWLREVCHGANASVRENVPNDFLETRRYIESRYKERIEISDLARMTGLCPPHFITKFKKYFGAPPLQFQLNLKLSQAAYLLHDNNLSVSQVAEKIGLDDPFYFSKLFKRKFNKSPLYYRRDERI